MYLSKLFLISSWLSDCGWYVVLNLISDSRDCCRLFQNFEVNWEFLYTYRDSMMLDNSSHIKFNKKIQWISSANGYKMSGLCQYIIYYDLNIIILFLHSCHLTTKSIVMCFHFYTEISKDLISLASFWWFAFSLMETLNILPQTPLLRTVCLSTNSIASNLYIFSYFLSRLKSL